MRESDEDASTSSSRVELSLSRENLEDSNSNTWYGFSIYIEDWEVDSSPDLIAQWHHDRDGNVNPGPPLTLTIEGNELRLTLSNELDNNNQRVHDITILPKRPRRDER